MTALGLGDVEAFPFVDPPDRRNVKDGVDLLVELGALDPAGTTRASA
jgi:ATP-dependent helicase HrpA